MSLNRRDFISKGLIAGCGLLSLGSKVIAEETLPAKRFMPQLVEVRPGFREGDIHVDSAYHFVYLIMEKNTAIRYGCAVGEEGKEFKGKAVIGKMAKWPKWTPTQRMIDEEPEKYRQWAKGMPGGEDNPLGARALYLYRNGKDTIYRIHGTPQPWTIGMSVSSGCIRMINDHIADLYERVEIGTRVIVH